VWKTTDSSREFIERLSKWIDWIHYWFFGETRYESRNRIYLTRKEWNAVFQSSSLTFGQWSSFPGMWSCQVRCILCYWVAVAMKAVRCVDHHDVALGRIFKFSLAWYQDPTIRWPFAISGQMSIAWWIQLSSDHSSLANEAASHTLSEIRHGQFQAMGTIPQAVRSILKFRKIGFSSWISETQTVPKMSTISC